MKNLLWKRSAVRFSLTFSVFAVALMWTAAAVAATPEWWKGSTQEYNRLVDSAKKEGKLIWYDSLDDKGAAMVAKEFNKTYPFITVEHVRARGLESRETILRELQAKVSTIDVLEVSDELIETYKELGLFKKYDWDKNFHVNKIQMSKDDSMLKVGASLHGFAYNTDKVAAKDAPKSWEDLLDPKWKNRKIGMDERPKSYIALVPAWGEQKVIDYAKRLGKQEIVYKRGTTAGIQMLAAGEFSIYATATFDSFMKVKKKGAHIDFVLPTPAGCSYEREGVISNSPHAGAAILFLGWLASGNGGAEVRDIASSGEGLALPGFKTQSSKYVKSVDQLSIFDDEWLPKKQELHRKISEAMGFKI